MSPDRGGPAGAPGRRAPAAGSSRPGRRYFFVPGELGLEDEPLLLGVELLLPDVLVSVELEDPLGGVVVVDGGVDGVVAVGGEADGGVRPPGRSPTRSVPDSLQAVSSVAPSATAQRPVSTLFIFEASSWLGLRGRPHRLQRSCRYPP
jgi:hypothetical protein